MKIRLLFALFVFLLIIGTKLLLFPDATTIATDGLKELVQYESPDGTYSLKLYLKNGGLFLADYSFVGQLINNKTEQSKNILWLGPSEEVSWIDGQTLLIQDHRIENGQSVPVERSLVHVKTETYDFRWDSVNWAYGWIFFGVLMLVEAFALLMVTLATRKRSNRLYSIFGVLTVLFFLLSVFFLVYYPGQVV